MRPPASIREATTRTRPRSPRIVTARDYELCHIHYLPLTKKDARREESMRALLAQLFSIIAPYEGTAFPRKARRILNDPEVRAARRVLIGQLMPPVARLDAP